jgi:hypothetical protein
VTVSDDPAAGHLDLDALAELEEGLVDPETAAVSRAHVDACTGCRAQLSRLRTTRALLSALPPEPMPADVAARVDAAVRSSGEVPAPSVLPLNRRRRLWGSPAVAGGAAAAAVVVLVAALVAGNVIHGGGKSTTRTPAAGSADTNSSLPKTATTKTWSTGRDYTAATIPTLVPTLVTGVPPSGAVSAPSSVPTPAAPSSVATSRTPSYTQDELRASPQAVAACGEILAGGVSTTPVAIDFARFDGKPAVIFVLPAIGHATELDVWVVRSACSAANLDLYFQRIPRP